MASHNTTLDYDKFDPEWYINTYYSTEDGKDEEGELLRFILDSLADFSKEGQIKGKKLLDLGSGPCVYTVVCISPYVDEIVLSDYCDANIRVLREWKEGSRDLHMNIFKYLVEKINTRKTVGEFIIELRSKVKSIEKGDVRQNPVLNGCAEETYDVVTSSLCFEAAVDTVSEYEDIVKNVSRVLKTNGYLLLGGVLEETFYRVGKQKFRVVPLNKDQVIDIYKKNGFEIQNFKYFAQKCEDNEFSDFTGMFSMLAKKIH